MKELDIKATIYDIFGYFLPGVIIMGITISSYEHAQGLFELSYFNQLVSSLDAKKITLVFFLAYVLGHVLSSLSSLTVEKNLIYRLNVFSFPLSANRLVSEGLNTKLKGKFKELTNTDFTDRDFRFLIAYVEAKQPAVYSTAFVYLSIYGMARTIAFTLTVGFIWEAVNTILFRHSQSIVFTMVYLASASILYFHYYRFLRYFKEQIVMGFILPT